MQAKYYNHFEKGNYQAAIAEALERINIVANPSDIHVIGNQWHNNCSVCHIDATMDWDGLTEKIRLSIYTSHLCKDQIKILGKWFDVEL